MRVRGFEVDAQLWGALRDGQRGSIETALAFLKKSTVTGSCLISLPTGAGKTGVITLICHLAKQGRVLVVSHRKAVRDQLFDEIAGGFLEKIAPSRRIQTKPVYQLTGSQLIPGIHVSTFQKLAGLPPDELEALKSNVDLLIVDEGHSEPSPVWSQVARGLRARKIVVTATPYRNDLFAFDIDSSSSYVYTFAEAVRQGVLEAPGFEVHRAADVVQRVNDILSEYPGAKCIVKCKSFEEIEHNFRLFSPAFKTLAIHDRFTGRTTDENRVSVPAKLRDSDWEVIVHQHKLDEGVDIPQAKVLVLTYNVGSGRELVQAVGRVVRKFADYPSYVIESESQANRAMWANYREFDTYLASPEKQTAFLRSLDTANLLKNYLDGFPEVSYFESSFRKKFDLGSIDVQSDLKIPLASVCFVRKLDGFSLEATTDRLMWDATRDGELVNVKLNQCGMNVVLAICFKNSKFLHDHLFFEPSLEITIFKELDTFVAVFDSRGRDFSNTEEYKLGSAVDVNALLTLAARSHATRTKEAHAAAIATTSRRPEHTAIRGRNLETIGSSQSNSAYALTTVKVDNLDVIGERHSSYYLGVGSGRVSDQMNRNFSLQEFDEWIRDIAAVIQEPPASHSALLGSYAKPIHHRPTLPPVSAIIDLSEYQAPLQLTWDDKTATIDNSFIYSSYERGFSFVGGAPELKFNLDYADDGRAVISCSEDVGYRGDIGGPVEIAPVGRLIDLLNKCNLKVLYADGTSYFNGDFYQVTLPSERGFELDQSKLGACVVAVSELLRDGLSEKAENEVDVDEFSPSSIFYLIDQLKAVSDPAATIIHHGPFFSGIADLDLLLCTDMGTEPADFILSSPTKLVFVHVKCGDASQRPQSSAGALAEVGSQAIKNLEVLTSANRSLMPGNWASMRNHWPVQNAPRVLRERVRLLGRKRIANPDVSMQLRVDALRQAWDIVADRRASPTVSKEIWLVAGNSFSRSHFERQLRRGNRAVSESLQAFQLIDSWQSLAANNDVAFKIFASP